MTIILLFNFNTKTLFIQYEYLHYLQNDACSTYNIIQCFIINTRKYTTCKVLTLRTLRYLHYLYNTIRKLYLYHLRSIYLITNNTFIFFILQYLCLNGKGIYYTFVHRYMYLLYSTYIHSY